MIFIIYLQILRSEIMCCDQITVPLFEEELCALCHGVGWAGDGVTLDARMHEDLVVVAA
jgi:hypothetical protein